jgi:RimJ/RimL family protein N-acetyltransferase
MTSHTQKNQAPIHTPRLTLIPFDPDNDTHCDFLVELYNSPEVQLANAAVQTEILDRESVRHVIGGNQIDQLRTGFGRFIVTLNAPVFHSTNTSISEEKTEREPEPVFIGSVGLKLRRPPGPIIPDIGFSVLRPYWGHGYATEACTALLQYFQEEKGVKDVLGYCSPENENSKKMFRRLGFEDRGVRTVSGLGRKEVVARALVWAKPGMKSDLGVYRIGE